MQNKYILTGKLVTKTAFRCGSAEKSSLTDLSFVRDGGGDPYIPGTSLAGAIRAYMEQTLGVEQGNSDPLLREFLGFQDRDDGRASNLVVADAPVIKETMRSSTRDHVVIMPHTGAAATGLKFDEEVLEAGSVFKIALEWSADDSEFGKVRIHLIREVVEAFQKEQIILGAAGSRGMGRVQLTEYRLYRWNLHENDDFEDYLDYLANGSAKKTMQLTELPESKESHHEYVEVAVECAPDGPFMIKDAVTIEADEKDYPDMVCRIERDDNGNEVVTIPGSSIKGAFRARAEKIVRWMEGTSAVDPLWYKEIMEDGKIDLSRFRAVLDKYRTNERVSQCFGDSEKGQGSYFFRDAYFNVGTNQKVMNHVAIDPLTGGGIDSALFAMQPLWDENARFLLNIRLEKPQLWQLGLMAHLLRDLADGFIRLGFGKTKGMGRIVIKRVAKVSGRLSGLSGSKEIFEYDGQLTEDVKNALEKIQAAFETEFSGEDK